MRRGFKYSEARLSETELLEFCAPFVHKLVWFATRPEPYVPHYYQQLFHSLHGDDGKLLRFRHLVAGRRGGKTLSAAWELLYYCINPEQFHWDVHQKQDDRPIYAWVLFKDNPTGKASWDAFREVCKSAGLVHGRDYKENRSNRWFEFTNGAFVHFRTADDPQSLRGAGLDILWIDEAAFIPNEEAYQVARPALADKEGIVFTTTTPKGKNWVYDEWWSERALADPNIGRVEYRSIDNPYFTKKEWEYFAKTYHPMLFRQELMAAFDALSGRELLGAWLHYYTLGESDGDKVAIPRKPDNPNMWDLQFFMGVDPAISLSDRADKFAMALVGVSRDNLHVFILRIFAGQIPFPEQIEKIQEWHIQYRPTIIAVESNAYQAALSQQLMRLENHPPVVPIISKQKKFERILGMAPMFRIGKVLVHESQRDFIEEWVDYDSTLKNPKDDVLDAVEIALQAAGVILPFTEFPAEKWFDFDEISDLNEVARRDLPLYSNKDKYGLFDEILGGDW